MNEATQIAVRVERCLNANFRSFLVSRRVSESPREVLFQRGHKRVMPTLSEVGDLGNRLVHAVAKISGVFSVIISPQIITVEKSDSYGWQMLESQLVQVIQNFLSSAEVAVTQEAA